LKCNPEDQADFPEARIVIIANLNDPDFETAACDAGALRIRGQGQPARARRIPTR
jgi:hypothetical protein